VVVVTHHDTLAHLPDTERSRPDAEGVVFDALAAAPVPAPVVVPRPVRPEDTSRNLGLLGTAGMFGLNRRGRAGLHEVVLGRRRLAPRPTPARHTAGDPGLRLIR
jgi:hypothetical protein